MAIIRFRNPKTFGERSNSGIEKSPKKRFIIATEGSKTEQQYFNGIFDYRKEIGISNLIDIVVLDRTSEHKSSSHPLNILHGLLEKMGVEGDLGVEELLEYPQEDEFWIIIDRDPQNFKVAQLSEFAELCKEHNISIGMTNPCFEFWLLLHLGDIERYDYCSLLENRYVNTKRRFTSKELSKRLAGGYNKKSIKFTRFIDKVDIAIHQERLFCQDIDGINTKLGSNIGLLISRMKNL